MFLSLFLAEDFNAFADIMLVDVRAYEFNQYKNYQPGLRTWLAATCDGLAAILKTGGTLVVIAPTLYASYWIEELDKLLTNKAPGGFLDIFKFRMIYKY